MRILQIIKRYLKLYFSFARICLLRELEYRVNFTIGTISGFLWALVTFSSISIIFTNSGEIAGWGVEEAVLLTFSYYVANSLYRTIFHINLNELGSNIKDGAFDAHFIKPVNAIFTTLLRKINISQLIRTAVFAVGLFFYAFRLNPNLTLVNLFIAYLLIFIGSLSFTFVVLIINCYSFWKPRIWNLMFLSDRIRSFSEIPSEVYRGGFRLFVYALPIASYATIPTKFLLGEGNVFLILYSVVQLLIFAFIAKYVWERGLMKYEGIS